MTTNQLPVSVMKTGLHHKDPDFINGSIPNLMALLEVEGNRREWTTGGMPWKVFSFPISFLSSVSTQGAPLGYPTLCAVMFCLALCLTGWSRPTVGYNLCNSEPK